MDPPLQGTPKGDVYSFAVVVQEVLMRDRPFCSEAGLAPEGTYLFLNIFYSGINLSLFQISYPGLQNVKVRHFAPRSIPATIQMWNQP